MLDQCECSNWRSAAVEWEDSVLASRVLSPLLDSHAPSGGSHRYPGAICKGSALIEVLALKLRDQGVCGQAVGSGGSPYLYFRSLESMVGFARVQWWLTESSVVCLPGRHTHALRGVLVLKLRE